MGSKSLEFEKAGLFRTIRERIRIGTHEFDLVRNTTQSTIPIRNPGAFKDYCFREKVFPKVNFESLNDTSSLVEFIPSCTPFAIECSVVIAS